MGSLKDIWKARTQENHIIMAPSKWQSGKAEPTLSKRLQITQTKGKQWKKEVRKYLIAYRSTPHVTTVVSPAELLFGRKIWTKLPEFHEDCVVSEVQDRDGEMKVKAKLSKQNEMQEQGAGKESESSSCPTTPTASPLTRTFACHSTWRGYSQLITFLGNRVRLVLGEPA